MRKSLAILSISLLAAGACTNALAVAGPLSELPQLLARSGQIDNLEADNSMRRNDRRQRERSVPVRPPVTKPVPSTARPPARRQAPQPSARPARVAPPAARPQVSRPVPRPQPRPQPRIDNLERDNALGISERRRQEARARERARDHRPAQRVQPSRQDAGPSRGGRATRHSDRRVIPSHRHARPRHGSVVRVLPPQRHHHVHRGHDYFLSAGAWYRPNGASFVVVAPPFGLVVPLLPSVYERRSYGNYVYYVADDVYYRRVDRGYEVVQSPVRESGDVADLDAYEDMPVLKIFAREQQSQAELINEKVQCHYQAVDRTGYDPTISGGGVPSDVYLERKHDYRRAISACLDRRGYTVR